jgi:hypothetical protein
VISSLHQPQGRRCARGMCGLSRLSGTPAWDVVAAVNGQE